MLQKLPLNTFATRREVALTRRFLTPAATAIEALFLEIRAETDLVLGQGAPALHGQPYPLGYCLEITQDVFARLSQRLLKPKRPGERAILAFLANGGNGHQIWGVLREQYFQNALRLGGLYIDVANDTVNIAKPKVEILPIEASGFAFIRDTAHFAKIAQTYWGVRLYANHALPSLAPLFPMIGALPNGRAVLLSAAQYMVDLLRSSDFTESETWLSQGPPPPPSIIEVIRAGCPEDLLAANVTTGQEPAIEHCRVARRERRASDAEWFAARVADMKRLRSVIPVP